MARSPGRATVNQINQGTIYTFPPTPPPKKGSLFFLSLGVAFALTFPSLLQTRGKESQRQSGEDAS